jgi:hypothetical protein
MGFSLQCMARAEVSAFFYLKKISSRKFIDLVRDLKPALKWGLRGIRVIPPPPPLTPLEPPFKPTLKLALTLLQDL